MAGFCIVMLMMGFFLPVILVILLLCLMFLVIVVFNYFLESFALYRMLKNSNYKYPLLAWVPFYNRVYLGEVAGNKKLGYITFILRVIYLVILFVFSYFMKNYVQEYSNIYSYVIMIISVVVYILNTYLVHIIMKKTIPKLADILTIVNVFTLGISRGIVLFILRNRKELIINNK
jgi:hypothetical protein